MKTQVKRTMVLLLVMVIIFSNIPFFVLAEETMNQSQNVSASKTYYRYREKSTMGRPYQISETSSVASEWTLYKIESYREYCLRENGYISDHYTVTTANAITYERVKYYETGYSWDPNLVIDYEYLCVGYVYNTKYDGSGVDREFTYKLTIPFTDSSGRTYYEYSGMKLYYQGTCQLYTLVVYSEYYYYYYKWSEWSEWSETPIEATDDIEVETKTVDLFTVIYDANGGSGAPESTTKEANETVMLSENVPTKEKHQFLGWATSADGEVEYAPGDDYSDNADITLYAIWKNVTEYTVTYDANGGTDVPAPQVKVHGETITITSGIPIKDGYSFMGWSTMQDGEIEYISGATYSTDVSILLYAVWEENVNIIASGVCGEGLSWTLYDNGVLLISGTGAMYDWSSGSETPWWSYRTQIETVTVEEGCTTIGSHAFAILSGMTPYTITNVHLPNTLASINYRAFYLCASITAVVFPDNVETIEDYAFYKCIGIQKLSFGENITTIGSYAFYTCTSLKNIKLDSKLESLGGYAFACCDSVETVEIQENLKTIGLEAFISCDNLQKITVHPDNPYFTNDAYGVLYDSVNRILIQYPIGNQTSSYVIDDSTAEIARSAFSGCYNLQEVYLPKSLKIIDAYNFSNSVYEQIPVMYYAGTSVEWAANITVKAPDSTGLREAMSYDVAFNNGAAEYLVSYNNNGSNWLETIDAQIKIHNIDLVLTTEKFQRTGYKFKGWSTAKDGDVEYLPGDIYSENANTTLYAIWELCEHNWDEGVITTQPTHTTYGERTYTCADCSATKTEQIDKTVNLSFAGAALTLHHNLAINYKVDAALFERGYSNPYVIFEFNGEKKIVDTYSVEGDRYVFSFSDIAPNQMNDTIYATLYASFGGVEYSSETKEYSVATYCYSILEKCSGNEYAELRTLLVDLLHYGAASQVYTDYNTNALVDARLTGEQKQWGTSTERTYESILNSTYQSIADPSVEWKGAGLNLQDAVTMRLKFSAESIDGLVLVIESNAGTWEITSEDFVQTDGGYYAFFNGLNASQLSDPVYMTFYDGDTPVSNTARYSIESYASSNQNSSDAALAELIKAMMRYGDSAYAYVN